MMLKPFSGSMRRIPPASRRMITCCTLESVDTEVVAVEAVQEVAVEAVRVVEVEAVEVVQVAAVEVVEGVDTDRGGVVVVVVTEVAAREVAVVEKRRAEVGVGV